MIPNILPEPPAVEHDVALIEGLAFAYGLEPLHTARTARRGDSFEARDDVAAALIERGLVLGEGRDGALYVECPWKAGHSGDSGITEAAWFPAGTGGFERGHYRCLHASCLSRTDDDFLEAVGLGASEDFEVVPRDSGGPEAESLPVDAPRLPRDKNGKIEATLPNLIDALRAAAWVTVDIAMDTFREQIVTSPHGAGEWRPVRDADLVRVREWLERRGFKPIGRELMRDAMLRIADEQRFDSASQWLEGLVWDGVPRIETFLVDHFGCADTPYVRAVARYWWSGHAARVLDPGHRCDMVPILVSPEGRYKSSTLQALVPDLEAFIEVDLDHRDDDLSRKMRGALLGELAELRGLRGRSAEANKAWVTRRFEEWTPKYQENSVRLARRLMFVGTTNETTFLDSTTGRRRWLPVVVQGAADPAVLKAVREQLWAEGAAAYRANGEVEWRAAYELADPMRDDFVLEDVWQSAVERWLADEAEKGAADVTQPGNGGEVTQAFTTEHAFICALGRSADKVSHADRGRMAAVLRAINYELRTTRVEGRPAKRWMRLAELQ